MSSRPKVSVVSAVHNERKEVVGSLRSILEQDGVELELVIVDDGSTDGTADVLQGMEREDLRIQLVRQQNCGLTRALVAGCALARGEYIARQDIGDISLPGRLRKQVAALDRDVEAVMVTSGYRSVGPGGEILEESLPAAGPEEWTEILREADEKALYGPHHGTVVFRKSAYEKVGGYRSEFFFAQDLDLWTRLVQVGNLDSVPEILYQAGFNYHSISACYRTEQRQLRHVIAQATQRRAKGESEADLVRTAKTIRPRQGRERFNVATLVESDYFVGSCLATRRDTTARQYFRQVLRRRPLHARAWAKLVYSYMPGWVRGQVFHPWPRS